RIPEGKTHPISRGFGQRLSSTRRRAALPGSPQRPIAAKVRGPQLAGCRSDWAAPKAGQPSTFGSCKACCHSSRSSWVKATRRLRVSAWRWETRHRSDVFSRLRRHLFLLNNGHMDTVMCNGRQFEISRAVEADVPGLVALLADDVLGATRESRA